MATVLVIGSTNVDLAVQVERHPLPGETLAARSMHSSPGGKGANQALAARLNGADVMFAGKVGTDPYADEALELLRAADVDLALTDAVDGTTGMAFITIDDAGENSIVIVPGANGGWDAADVDRLRDTIDGATVVLCQGEIPAHVVDAVAETCEATATRFVLNLAPVINVSPTTIRRADPLVVNEHEARLAADILDLGSADDDDALLRAIVAAGVPSVVMTRGAASTLVATAEGLDEVPSRPVEAVDTTGAGDAFTGAFVARLAHGVTMEDAAQVAAAFAADTVTRRGAQESYRTLG